MVFKRGAEPPLFSAEGTKDGYARHDSPMCRAEQLVKYFKVVSI
jgi:hypothetical protein